MHGRLRFVENCSATRVYKNFALRYGMITNTRSEQQPPHSGPEKRTRVQSLFDELMLNWPKTMEK